MFGLGPIEIFIILLIVGALIAVPVGIIVAVTATRRRQPTPGTFPNLTPCPDCQQAVSIHATACPHCGRPRKSA